MTNVLKQAINRDDMDRTASIIIGALGIETDELANFRLKHWPSERKHRARIIGHRLSRTVVCRMDGAQRLVDRSL
jgi:hypothetical protein